MTGTYHLNFNFGNDTNDTGFFGNLSAFNSDKGSSSSDSNVQTYTDGGSSNVETKEDTTPDPTPEPSPEPTPSPSPTNRTAKGV